MTVASMSGVMSRGRRVEVDGVVAVGEGGPGDEVVAGDALGVVQHDDVLEGRELVAHGGEALGEAHVLDDGHPGAAVPREVGDLLGGRRVVDRDGGGAAEDRGEVDDVELGDVPHHQHDAVARADAERPQPRRGAGDPVGERRRR